MGSDAENIATMSANWWANTLVDPRFDNGEIGLATVLARSAVKDISDQQLDEFKSLLKEYILTEVDKLTTPEATFILSCDYGPDANLNRIASQCLISELNFPWKTTMWIGKDFCQVKYGYSMYIEYLYVTEARLLRCIKSAEDTIKYYETKDDEYFEGWSSFSKEEILNDAHRELELAKQNLQKFKAGIPVDQLRVH